MFMRFRAVPFAAAVALATLAVPAHVLAGPPLLCHPFEIGGARSLPWDGSRSWAHGRADYALAGLVADTEALLVPATPVIVRMETLRRAAIYASRDRAVADALVASLMRRAAGDGRADPLAAFDAGYLIETLRQISQLGGYGEFRDRAPVMKAVVGAADGRALVARAIEARPADGSLQFAAALIAASTDRAAYETHARRARALAGQDALLARNLHQIS